jgi:hypothetical protein
LIDILHRSDNLEVRRITAGDGAACVVTFDSYHQEPGTDRPGFGEAYLAERGVSAIHIVSHGNDWFQYPEMMAVLAIVREACAEYDRRMTYGSSMGGYAALRFADAIGADAALALSPQWSVDPRKAPFETRWAQDRRRIRFLPELDGPIRSVPRMLAAFDPALSLDRVHAQALADEAPIELLELPYAGHPCGPFLSDIGLLHPLVSTMLAGTFDQKRFMHESRHRRGRSPSYLATLADAQPKHRQVWAIALAEQAVSIAPNGPSFHDTHARSLAAAGRFADAVAAHRQAIALEPLVDYRWSLSKTYHAAGDIAGALAVAREIQNQAPDVAGYHAWAAKLQTQRGDLQAALGDWRRALALDSRNRDYRRIVAWLSVCSKVARWWAALFGR